MTKVITIDNCAECPFAHIQDPENEDGGAVYCYDGTHIGSFEMCLSNSPPKTCQLTEL